MCKVKTTTAKPRKNWNIKLPLQYNAFYLAIVNAVKFSMFDADNSLTFAVENAAYLASKNAGDQVEYKSFILGLLKSCH